MATHWTGGDKLRRKLRAMPAQVAIAASRALVQNATELVGKMQNAVAFDSGELHDSIRWEFTNAGGGAETGSSIKGSTGLSVTVSAGGGLAFYASWVEFGTPPHINGGKFAGTQHPGTEKQPFFWPIYRLNRTRIKRRLSRAQNKAIKEVAARG
jgi:HK97 gp10 family phage protein